MKSTLISIDRGMEERRHPMIVVQPSNPISWQNVTFTLTLVRPDLAPDDVHIDVENASFPDGWAPLTGYALCAKVKR
jgi:hypothetical protein